MTDTVDESLAAIVPTSNHIASAAAQGITPSIYIEVIRNKLADTVEAMALFLNTMPADDENIAAVQALMEQLT